MVLSLFRRKKDEGDVVSPSFSVSDELEEFTREISKPEKVERVHSKFDVSPEFWLWTCDGFSIKNRKDLVSSFSKMSDSSFKVHVRSKKNDFSDWARDVLGDDDLAKDLLKAKDKVSALRLAKKHSRKKSINTSVLSTDPVHKDFDRKENKLLRSQRLLDGEEEELNNKILELEARRARIFAEIAALERERFYYSVFWQTNNSQRKLSLKDLNVSKEVALEVIKKRISEARELANGGLVDEGELLLEDVRKHVSKCKLSKEDKGFLDHLLEIAETELKIESLKNSDS